MSKILIILCLSLALNAANLNIQKGEIIAHTEVFGDSQISPSTKEINTFLTIQSKSSVLYPTDIIQGFLTITGSCIFFFFKSVDNKDNCSSSFTKLSFCKGTIFFTYF